MRNSGKVISKNIRKQRGSNGDVLLLVLVVLLAVYGVIAVYSASNYTAQIDYGNKYYYFGKQIIGVVLGAAAMIFTANFDYRKYKKFGIVFYAVGLILLMLVFVPGLGVESYGAKRWIGIAGITIQPSEIAKFAYVFLVAGIIGNDPGALNTFKGIIKVCISGGIVCLLIMCEPNMSVTMCVGLTMLTLLFCCGLNGKIFAVLLVPIALAVPVLIIAEPYRLKRLKAFLNPWENPKGEGYQLLQSLYALGSGNVFGVGLFKSRQKYRFLPFAESDFILAVIGEETGLFGVLLLFAVIFVVIYKGYKIAGKCNNFYGFTLCVGITTVYAVQVVINALVVTGSIPPTGLPLPLISAGNTSIIVFMAMFGVVYNISKDSKSPIYIDDT